MDDENLRRVYEQYWLHARHQEVQRLWFTNIYSMIVAGTFAYFGAIKGFSTPLLVFLILLSILGYLVTYSWNIPFVIYSRLAEEIAVREWDLPKDYRRFTKYRKGYEFGKMVSANTVFIGFYSLMAGIFVGLSLQTNLEVCTQLTLVIIAVLFLTFLGCYKFYLKPKSIDKIQDDFEKRIKKYDENNQK